MTSSVIDGCLTFKLEGRVDSSNVDAIESEIRSELSLVDDIDVAFDAKDLEYISSAGLRVLLKIKKEIKRPVRVFNVSDEVFDIFEVTGFDEILVIERAMRNISIRGCDRISSALNGEIFQLSEDEMVKVYGKDVTLEEIKKERSYAKTALVSGIPTLIPYDVVKCEAGYGIVFEKADMNSLAYILSHEPDRLPELAERLASLMKEMHSTEVPPGKLPDIKDRYREWISKALDDEDPQALVFSNLFSSIPDSDTYVHGDINLNSVMVKKDELILLDMAGSACGHALFDLQSLFASLVAIEKTDEGYCRRNFGISAKNCVLFWNLFFKSYMNDKEQEIRSMNELLAKYYILKQKILLKLEKRNRFGR